MTVSPCPGCFCRVYQLTDPKGRQLTLDPEDSATGIWVPEPDGRSCRRITVAELHDGARGHATHHCAAPIVQPSLFDTASQP